MVKNNSKIKLLNDKEGIDITDPLFEYNLLLNSDGDIATRFMIKGNSKKDYFAIVEFKHKKLFLIHNTLTDERAFLVKDKDGKLKEIFENLMDKIEKELTKITGTQMYYIDSENFKGNILFGGEYNHVNENKKLLSAINVFDEVIPVEIIKKGKAVVALISGEDFLRVFFNIFNNNFKIKGRKNRRV